MAKIALRIWSAIMSTFAILVASSPANASTTPTTDLGGFTIQRSKKPELFLEKASAAVEEKMVVAGHRSHASHSSHRSHYSGYGSSGGSNYSTNTPSYEPSSSADVNKTPSSGSSTPRSNTTTTGGRGANSSKAQKSISGPEKSSSDWTNVNRIVLKYGGTLSCDYAWQDGDKINVLVNGKVLRFEATEIDIDKSLGK